MKWPIFIGVVLVGSIHASEFVYPVAAIPHSNDLLVIYQKTPHHIELWQCNMSTHHAEHVLLSRYTPAGLKILPDGSGYSFIDNELIVKDGKLIRNI